MLGGFRKSTKRGNLRKKTTTNTGDSDDEDGEVVGPMPVVQVPAIVPMVPIKEKVKIKAKVKNNSTTNLSFGDELEHDGDFVVKRTKASLSLQEQVTKDKKRKKKKETTLKKDVLTEHRNLSDSLSNSPIQIKTFEDKDDSGDDDSMALHRFSLVNNTGIPGAIPNAATIYAMKKKREQARQFGGALDYIPVNKNKYEGRFSSGNSRLVREDLENDSSGDERVEMKGQASHPALERRKQVAKALEDAQDDEQAEIEDDDGDELQRWEDEQIKKGSHMPINHSELFGPKLPESSSSSVLIPDSNLYRSTMPDPNSYSGAMPLPALPPPPPFPLLPNLVTAFSPQMFPPMSSLPTSDEQNVSVDMIAKRLSEQLDTKKQLFRLHERQKEKTKFDLDSSKDNIVTLERKAADTSDRFTFYQDIRGFVRDLIECLNEKVIYFNYLIT